MQQDEEYKQKLMTNKMTSDKSSSMHTLLLFSKVITSVLAILSLYFSTIISSPELFSFFLLISSLGLFARILYFLFTEYDQETIQVKYGFRILQILYICQVINLYYVRQSLCQTYPGVLCDIDERVRIIFTFLFFLFFNLLEVLRYGSRNQISSLPQEEEFLELV